MTPVPTIAPYGAWSSPLSADAITAGTVRFGQVSLSDSTVYWEEGRPREAGRVALMSAALDGTVTERVKAPYSVRSRVHEYGGGAHLVDGDTVYFCNFADQGLYVQRGDAEPERMGHYDRWYFTDFCMDSPRRRLLAVREDHSVNEREAAAALVAIDLDAPHAVTVLSEGHDFYSSPALDATGERLTWITWEHPQMPWDGTDLWLASVLQDGTIATPVHVAGSAHESVVQPRFSPAGELWWVSDSSGWWNLYRRVEDAAVAVAPRAAEFATGHWVFGLSTYGFASAERAWCIFWEDGVAQLAAIDIAKGTLATVALPYQDLGQLRVGAGYLACEAGSPVSGKSIVRMDLATRTPTTVNPSPGPLVPEAFVSVPESITFPTVGARDAHAFYYAPCNPQFRAPDTALPPLVVMSHGGPTSATVNSLSTNVQFWTTRGFAVVDVNYGGSTGFGRAYRERLKRSWGIVDVDDCVAAATYLVERGVVDPNQLAIRGGSAGGFTTLSALAFRSVFKAGASHYGVGDLAALARDTHKFESRYLDGLVGPYPADAAVYEARSAAFHADGFDSALILFQGLKDLVVPPAQSESMFNAIKAKGLPVAYITFAEEGHGFRSGAAQKVALESELYFYGKIFGFTPADPIAPFPIENLP